MKRNLLFTFLTILISFCIAVFMVEGVVRVYYYGINGLAKNHINSFHNLYAANVAQKSRDAVLKYELIPNMHTLYKGVTHKTNKLKQRDVLYDSTGYKGVRIGLIGDSFTMGSGVEQANIYHSVAERKINKNASQVQMINYGVTGYNFNQYLSAVKRVIKNDGLDKLIVGFCKYNDHFVEGIDYPNMPFKKEKESNLFWKWHSKNFVKKLVKANTDSSFYIYKDHQIQYVDSCFNILNQLSKQYDTPILIYVVGVHFDSKVSTIIQTLAKSNKLAFADGTEIFQGYSLKKVVLSDIDSHPNDFGHQLLSEKLIDYVNINWVN
jgi:hypothetical protein